MNGINGLSVALIVFVAFIAYGVGLEKGHIRERAARNARDRARAKAQQANRR